MSEAIGGYLSENRIDALKNDTEIYTTFEGDNTVLMHAKIVYPNSEIIWQNGCHGNNQLCMKMPKRLFLKRTDCNQKTDESHLIDQDFHLLAFQHRKNNFSICSKANKKTNR
jgi:acyl-CoA oxidase